MIYLLSIKVTNRIRTFTEKLCPPNNIWIQLTIYILNVEASRKTMKVIDELCVVLLLSGPGLKSNIQQMVSVCVFEERECNYYISWVTASKTKSKLHQLKNFRPWYLLGLQ